MAISVVRRIAGHMLEVCTKAGEFNFYNISEYNATYWSMWPDGDYRTSGRFYDENDDNILNGSCYGNIQRS